MDWRLLALVAMASGIGGAARYLIQAWAPFSGFPAGTLAVNVIGCFLIGLIAFGGIAGGWLAPEARIIVGLGLLGGFTTMSTFTYETVALLESGAPAPAALNIGLTIILCLGGTFTGRAIGIAVWSPA
jgi:fluoride exporter